MDVVPTVVEAQNQQVELLFWIFANKIWKFVLFLPKIAHTIPIDQ
jgi:hypothetical protein